MRVDGSQEEYNSKLLCCCKGEECEPQGYQIQQLANEQQKVLQIMPEEETLFFKSVASLPPGYFSKYLKILFTECLVWYFDSSEFKVYYLAVRVFLRLRIV